MSVAASIQALAKGNSIRSASVTLIAIARALSGLVGHVFAGAGDMVASGGAADVRLLA